MLNEEEKKAIEIVKGLKTYYEAYYLLEDEEIKENEEKNEAIDTVLSLITKLERKIYDYDEIIARLEEENTRKDKIINEQLKENIRLQKELNEENKKCMILANNDKFKEQMIDEMAGYIAIIQDCPNENCGANLDCENRCTVNDTIEEECWKMYFERKVRE